MGKAQREMGTPAAGGRRKTAQGESGVTRARYLWPALVVVAGLVVGAGGGAFRLLSPPGTAGFVAGWTSGFAGMALFAAGVVTLLFAAATNRSFEWFMAWRYLKRAKGNPATLVVGLVLLVVGGTTYGLARHFGAASIGGIALESARYLLVLQAVALGLAVLGWLVTVFGALQLAFSVFTSISVFGVHLGTGALVVVLSVMGGFEQDLQQKILGTRAHVVVTRPDTMFTAYRTALRRVSTVSGVKAVSPYLESEVMVTSQTNHEGVLLRGIDPERIGLVTDLSRYMKAEGGAGSLRNLQEPRRLAKIPVMPFGALRGAGDLGVVEEPSSRPTSRPTGGEDAGAGRAPTRPVYPGVIVGAELARNLRLYVGDDVNLVAPLGGMSPAGPIPKSRPFRVAGIFYSGMYEFDTKLAYATIAQTQRFLGLDDEITGIEIKVDGDDVDRAVGVAGALRRTLGDDFTVRDWQQLNQKLFSALKLEKLVMFVVLIFIVLVASFSIVTNLVMVVLEKSKEIAALKALGSTSWSAFRIFFHAGLYIGIIGMLVGLLQGVGICTYLAHVGLPLDPEVYYISKLPVQIQPFEIAGVALAAVLLAASATIYPALRAARLQPVEGLRYD